MVSGSTPQAESAQLVFLVGGDAESLKRAEPLLKALGSSIQHAGPEGCGALAKFGMCSRGRSTRTSVIST
jgi:3-hydroxyisobutyrate dehydrogenase